MFYLKYNLKIEIATLQQIKNLLIRARSVGKKAKINYSRALESLHEYVDSPQTGLWQITPSGERFIRGFLKIHSDELETENDTTFLEKMVNAKVKDNDIKDYFQEGIDCLRIGRLRASIVFLWTGVIYLIRQRLIKVNLKKLNFAISKFDPHSRIIKNIDDFCYIKDSVLLLVMKEVGFCDKSEKEVLENCLDLRNKCGHPAKYSPGPKRVSAFIEDLISVIF